MAIKSLAQTLKDLATGIKNAIIGVTGSNATLTIIKGNGTTSTVTVNNVANAGAATKATQDSAGQQINSTYIKGLSVSGQTITYTKGNNTTGTITTQDTVYTHPNSGVTAGTYKSITVNAQGHVTAGSNPTTLAGYGITDASLKGHTHSQYLTASSDLNVNKLKGVISLDNLPAGALERLVKVTNDTARFALTTNDIQLGDTVKVESTKMMYIVKDITKLNSEDGYEQYTAGIASSVPWSGITGKPSSYTPSAHTHDDRYYTESEINSKVNTINSSIDTKADKIHTHDDRYYTESEIDNKVNTINTSINNKSDKTHTHDDRYYTESEINTKLSGKSDTTHTHNYLPLAGGTTTGKVNMKSANLDNLPQVFRTDGVNFAGIRFQNTNGYLGAIGITGNVNSVAQRLGSDGNLYPILDSSNYNSYAPTKTGTGASGTWGINISGKANTAGTADIAKKVSGTYSGNGGQQGPAYFGKQYTGFLMSNANVNSDTSYKNWLYMDNYGGSDAGGATALGVSRTAPRAFLMQSDANRSSWNNYAELLSTYNYNTYVPKKDGTGASGTWGINISGKANTAGTADTSKACSGNSATATKATQDSAGQQINTTYIKGLSVSGKTITYTKGNGSTGTITTQDTAYTHPNSGVTAGTYRSVTVNAQGHVTTGSNPTTLSGYGITDAPTKTGGGASGTWGINITGNAASATTANTAKVISGFVNIDNGTWGHSTGTYITGFQEKGGGSIQWRAEGGRLYERVDGTFWQREGTYEVIDTSTVNNYAPTKTGSGASGTWGINISGKANTAGTADTSKACSGNSATSTKLNSRGVQTAITAREEAGMYTHQVYNNGYPVTYGNVITVGGSGGGQLLLEWSGADKGIGHVFYRNRRDNCGSWSDWRMLALTTDNVASATKLATARNFKVNLASTGAASFNGTADATPGVTGTLPIANGGTGATTAAAARSNLGITCANIGAASASHTHSYVPLAGGTITGQISKRNISTSWVSGRNIAPFRTIAASSPGDSQYVPVLSAKTYQGSWDIGPYTSNILHFSYITDVNFNAGNNTQTADIQFHTNGTVVANNFSGAFNGISMRKDNNGNIIFS